MTNEIIMKKKLFLRLWIGLRLKHLQNLFTPRPYHMLVKMHYPKRLDLILLQTVSYLKCLSFKIQKWVNKIIDSLNVGSFLDALFFNMMLDKSLVVIYRRICIIIFSFLFNIYSFPIIVLNIIDSSWVHKNVLENQKKTNMPYRLA